MRAPVVAMAVVFGGAVTLTLGTLPACVVQPLDTVDAGADAGATATCDLIGSPCADCQRCKGTRKECGDLFQACEDDPDCVSISRCFDDKCDVLTQEPKIKACVAACCQNAYATASAVKRYADLAACVFGDACPSTCNLQRIHNVCPAATP